MFFDFARSAPLIYGYPSLTNSIISDVALHLRHHVRCCSTLYTQSDDLCFEPPETHATSEIQMLFGRIVPGWTRNNKTYAHRLTGKPSPPKNQTDLWNCGKIHHAESWTIGRSFLFLRDSREVTVSTCFHRVFHGLDLYGLK